MSPRFQRLGGLQDAATCFYYIDSAIAKKIRRPTLEANFTYTYINYAADDDAFILLKAHAMKILRMPHDFGAAGRLTFSIQPLVQLRQPSRPFSCYLWQDTLWA